MVNFLKSQYKLWEQQWQYITQSPKLSKRLIQYFFIKNYFVVCPGNFWTRNFFGYHSFWKVFPSGFWRVWCERLSSWWMTLLWNALDENGTEAIVPEMRFTILRTWIYQRCKVFLFHIKNCMIWQQEWDI